MMRALIGVVLIAAIGWSAYWWIGARNVEIGLRAWLDGRDTAGWVANYSTVETKGFPNRFDSTITDLELADPATGLAWTAPFFQVFQLSYKPNHVIAVWPAVQTLASPDQRIELTSESARGSLVFKPSTDLELDRSSFVFDGLELASTAGWTAEIGKGLFATRPSPDTDGALNIGAEATDIRPASKALADLAKAGVLPGVLEQVKIDATLTFDAPWDRRAIEEQRPQVTAMDLGLLQMRWGHLDIWAAGELTFSDIGLATGSITIKARNWREMLQLSVATGWIPESLAPTLESGLSLLAGLSGPSTTLDAPLTFKNGAVSFGPIPLGSMRPLILR